jgi:outer membrane receptor protein involved in Fe transport
MKSNTSSRIASACALALGLAAPLKAQTAPPAGSQTVELSPFIVDTTADRGYIAVDALAGGRTNTPIKLTPAAMSSLTRTFIDDVAIQDVREALRWSPNVVPSDPQAGKGFGGQAFQAWSYNFRGAGAGQQGGAGPTRNYFTFFENADTYNVERVEFTRGPNGILFGLGTVGGTLSTYTKVPRLDKNFLRPAVTADDNGSLRFEVDYNVAATDKLAIRLNALYDEPRGWREGDEGEKQGLTVAFLYKLTEKTTLRLELEGARNKQTLFSSNIGDKFSTWDGTTASQTWGAEPTGGSAPWIKIGAAGAWGDWLRALPVYIPNLGEKGLMPWGRWEGDVYRGGYATRSPMVDQGQALPLAPYRGWYPNRVKLPWETTWSDLSNAPVRFSKDWTYGHGRQTNDFEDLTAFLDHSFNEHFDLQLSFFTYDTETTAKDYEGTGGASVDINRQLPDGTPNPNFGKLFADFFMAQQLQNRSVDEYRGQLNYKIKGTLFGSELNQLLSFSASHRTTKISARQNLAQVGNSPWITNPADWVHNMVWGRLYLDQPNHFVPIPQGLNGYSVGYMPSQGYWFDFDDEFELTSYALFSHTRLFDERLSIALGARRDSYDEHLVSLRRGPNFTNQVTDESDAGTTYTAGAIYYFGWLGVFANYSESLLPPNAGSQPYINGARPGPEENEGFDYGIRISTGDGKYYATLSRYDSKSQNRNVENPINLRGIWQAYNVARGENGNVGLGSIAFSDTQALDASGYEFEITANPLSNLRLQASYALPDTEITDFYPMSRAHVAENLAEWNRQLAATSNTEHANNLRNAIAGVQDALAQAQGGNPQQGQVDYTAALYANYSFMNDALKGWSVGAGATFTGRSYLLTANNQEYYGTSFKSFNTVIAYETRLWGADVRFALNVDNILDEDDPIVTSYHWGYEDESGRRIRDGYYFQNPRTFRLSARFTF